jgi:spermidine synthase
MSDNKLNLWAEEIHQDKFKMGFKTTKALFSAKSPFQQVDVIETESHGRMLLNDGLVMITRHDHTRGSFHSS